MPDRLPFIDLGAQRDRLRRGLDAAIGRVLDAGAFIMGSEVGELEDALARYCGCRHAIACGNGTDALMLALMAEAVGPGDAVFAPAFTFVATAEVAPLVGATPVFVDVLADTYTMDPASLDAAVNMARDRGLRPRVVIPVDLFGQPADYPRLAAIADAHGLTIIADAAQSFGAALDGRRVGTFGALTTTSFFPAKPLGCYGDGGAVFTDDDHRAALLRSMRSHGKGTDKYDNVRVGVNSRLDTLQAAILLEKLAVFADEVAARERIARRYTDALNDVVGTPVVAAGATSVWAQYTIRVADPLALAGHLAEQGIPTARYYPIPLHRQAGYSRFPTAPDGLPVSERLSREVISLPMHPYLSPADQDRIIAAIVAWAHGQGRYGRRR